jgi:environmental stress-induced protein Ves
MKLIPADAMRRMPWKNGGGVTTEIAIAPTGATLEDFDWRVGTAQVDAAGLSHALTASTVRWP